MRGIVHHVIDWSLRQSTGIPELVHLASDRVERRRQKQISSPPSIRRTSLLRTLRSLPPRHTPEIRCWSGLSCARRAPWRRRQIISKGKAWPLVVIPRRVQLLTMRPLQRFASSNTSEQVPWSSSTAVASAATAVAVGSGAWYYYAFGRDAFAMTPVEEGCVPPDLELVAG